MQALRLRVRDAAHTCWTATFPSDRPSGTYAVFTCAINGGLLVWTFAVVLSRTCDTVAGRWVYLGVVHCFINMGYCIAVMFTTRRRIAAGIPEDMSQWRVCYSDPLTLLYLLYLIWEIVWMVAAGKYAASRPSRPCVGHLNVQVAFFSLYLILGTCLFYSTFMTEHWRRPHWRRFAAMRYDYLHNPTNQPTVRWRDEHAGDDGEPVELDRVGGGTAPRRGGSERTSTHDYASIMDDATTQSTRDGDRSRQGRGRRREGS